MKIDFESAVIPVLVGVFVASAAALFVIHKNQTDEYKAACTAVEGKPVHNGKHWECLKLPPKAKP